MEGNEHIFLNLFNISYFARKFTPILQCCNKVYHESRLQKTAIPNLTRGNLGICRFSINKTWTKKWQQPYASLRSVGKPHEKFYVPLCSVFYRLVWIGNYFI
jgi:hypothetical protein